MNLVVAVDQNWAIGNKGQLLFRLSADLKHFRELTTGHIVVYGRNTLGTFPESKPLKNRQNIILSHLPLVIEPPTLVAYSLDELKTLLATYENSEIFVIGGASVYEQLLPLCNRAYVTKILTAAKSADAFFPNLDKDKNWRLASASETYYSDNKTPFQFTTYHRQGQDSSK